MNIELEEVERPINVNTELHKLNPGESFLSCDNVFVKSDDTRIINNESKIMAMRLTTGEMIEFSKDYIARRVTIKATYYVE